MTQRPVIPGFHPDPSICRVGDTYYLANSSFEYAPGVPVFASTDLRSWEQIGNALDRPSQLDVSKAGPSGGVFAPTLRHHDGRFWMITTNWSDDGGQLLVHAEDPAGPWSEPVRIPSAVGIDPDLTWDDDGTCLMSYAGFGPQGGEGIVQSAIDPRTGEVLTERRQIWNGTGGKFPEGPHLYRIGDWWYLLIAEGGTERGHAVTIARSRSPQGPFEGNPANPVLTHRGTDLPVQNTGHADLVERPDGSWAIVYHGIRARGSSPEWHVLGRETFADDVVWTDGWPVLTGHIEPAAGTGAVVETVEGSALPPSWVGASCHLGEVVTGEDDGWRLTASGDGPVFVGRRQEHLFAVVRARLAVTGTGGLSLRIDPRHALDLEVSDGTVRAVWAVGDVRHELGRAELSGEAELELRALPSQGHEFSTARGPDRVVAGVVLDGAFTALGEVDGRYLSTEVAGGMTGRMAGIVSTSGSVLVRSFSYLGADDPSVVGGGAVDPPAVGVVTETVPNDLSARYLPPPEPTLRDDGVRQHRNAVYAAVPGYRVLELDLWVPGGGPSPVVVWVHGGAWMAGNRRLLPPGLRPDQLFEELLDAGLAVATIEYRHAREAPFPAQLHDAKAAVRWLRHHADVLGLDPDRIGIGGESAGGHLAALVGLTAHRSDLEGDVGVAGPSSAVAAVVDWYGVSSAETMPEFELPPEVAAALPPEALVPPLDVLLEGVDAETRAAVSPVAHVHAGAPPFLLLHGTADTVVPYAQSELLAEALQAVGADVRLEPVPGAVHGWDGYPEVDVLVRRSVDFLAAALGVPRLRRPGGRGTLASVQNHHSD